MKYKLFDVIQLMIDIPEEDLSKGDTGTIVECYTVPREGYEVEFVNPNGSTKALCTLLPDQIELAQSVT